MQYRFGHCQVDEAGRAVRCGGRFVRVEPKVFDLLVYLIHQRDRVVSKEELLRDVWGGQIVGDAALSRCVMLARKAIGDAGSSRRLIETFYRRGFRFVAPLRALRSSPVTGRPARVEDSPHQRPKWRSASLSDAQLLSWPPYRSPFVGSVGFSEGLDQRRLRPDGSPHAVAGIRNRAHHGTPGARKL